MLGCCTKLRRSNSSPHYEVICELPQHSLLSVPQSSISTIRKKLSHRETPLSKIFVRNAYHLNISVLYNSPARQISALSRCNCYDTNRGIFPRCCCIKSGSKVHLIPQRCSRCFWLLLACITKTDTLLNLRHLTESASVRRLVSWIASGMGQVFTKVVLWLEPNTGGHFRRVILPLHCLPEPESGQVSSPVCWALPTAA